MVDMVEKVALDDEPIGIIISRGSRAEAPTRLTAYVWGPVPEDAALGESTDNRAA